VSADALVDFDVVDVAGVSRHFGRRRALAKTSLTFRAGEIAGLFGPNGAGKSTLLGVLSTLVRPTSGEVRYGGATARALGNPLRGRIGVLGHDLFLYGDLSARENLEFFGQLYGLDRLSDRVARALAAARLEDRAGDRVSGFSRGLRQRLALERALLHDPRLVLLDEPFTGLDDESTALLADRLRGLRAAGAIVLMATHDFESADDLVDRMICLREGRTREVAADGSALRIRYRRTMAEAWL
jgi:ABC-type multidrug transport system ATPase subunit